MKHKTQKQGKAKIVRNADYNCAYVSILAVLIIFTVILQTVINLKNDAVCWRTGGLDTQRDRQLLVVVSFWQSIKNHTRLASVRPASLR